MARKRYTWLNDGTLVRYDLLDKDAIWLGSDPPDDARSHPSAGSVFMNINPIRPAATPPAFLPAAPSSEVAKPERTVAAPIQDMVDISPVARLLEELTRSGELRADKLARIKSEIESGRYETPEKLELAVRKMVESFRHE